MSIKLHRPKFYFHLYKEFEYWAIVVSLTTINATVQLGPIWISVAWFSLF